MADNSPPTQDDSAAGSDSGTSGYPGNDNPVEDVKSQMNKFFASKMGIVFVGAFIGIVAAILQHEGNPGNMGFCVACFERDIAGALGLHSAGVVQYLRPEIFGFVLGSLIAAILFREYRARTGSAPMIRFILGFWAMIGALVFLGCPWRASLRLAGGDGNAILGLAGLATGVFIGSMFIRNGFSLGRSRKVNPIVGLVIPAIALILFIGLLWGPTFDDGTSAFRESATGPGSMHAAVWLSFGIALAVGFLAQRSRFCTIAGIRDTILIRDYHLLIGIGALILAAFVTNLALGQFDAGIEDMPIAHHDHIWNFMGMVLAGLAFALAGGCPGRQLILSGEGDADAGVFVLGMVAGAAFSHNFRIAAGPDNPVTGANGGPGDWGAEAVILGLMACFIIAIAFTYKDAIKQKSAMLKRKLGLRS